MPDAYVPAELERPRVEAEYFPYPSCPVPAAGPLRVVGGWEEGSGTVLVRCVKRPKRGLVVERAGLGVRLTNLDDPCGLKSGIIPNPFGAGVLSLVPKTGTGLGFLDGILERVES